MSYSKYKSYAVHTKNSEEATIFAEWAKANGVDVAPSIGDKSRWYKVKHTEVTDVVKIHWSIAPVYTVKPGSSILSVEKIMEFDDWKEYVTPKKIVAYKLLKDTPKTKAGTVLSVGKYTPVWYNASEGNNGETFSETLVLNSPEWFEPIYEDETKVFVINANTPFVIAIQGPNMYVDYSEVDGPVKKLATKRVIRVLDLHNLVMNAKSLGTWNGWKMSADKITIGCRTDISVSQLEEVLEAYRKINKQ